MTLNQLRTYIIAALGLVGVVSLTLYTAPFDQDTRRPEPVMVDGQTISFPYTDSIQDEDLIIFTSTSTYQNGISHAEVYAAVLNASTEAQDVEIAAYFRDNKKRIRNVSVLGTVTQEFQDPIFSTNCTPVYDDLLATTTCFYEQIGTTTRQETKNVWGPLPTAVRDAVEVAKEQGWLVGKTRKQVESFVAENKTVAFPIKRGEVIYYKILIEFPPNQRDKFFLEAYGSAGGYGHLD